MVFIVAIAYFDPNEEVMASSQNLHIPKPCHEKWEGMQISALGRHCEVCDKVVRDFVGMDAATIETEIREAKGNVCGRVAPHVLLPPLTSSAAYAFPTSRVRLFVIAFLVAFGIEAWGVTEASARDLKPNIDALKSPDLLQVVLQQGDNEEVILHGLVLDVYTREPIAFAHVMAYDDGKLIVGTLSNAEGEFELRFPKSSLQHEVYQLRLRYLGREREDREIAVDIEDFVYLIDGSMMIDGISMVAEKVRDWNEQLMGDLISIHPINVLTSRALMRVGDIQSLYRPLDEWLMMHNSQIHHNGRW